MKYKTIIFDFYHTLVNIHTEEHDEEVWKTFSSHLEEYSLNFDPCDLRDRFFKMQTALYANSYNYRYPEIDITDILNELFQEQGKYFSKEELYHIGYDLRCCMREYIEVYEGVHELLKTLHDNGCKLILLSNAQRCFTMPEIEEMNLKSYFDAIYISSDYGCMKPDADFFNLIFQDPSVKKDECLMIGDSLTSDIAGADGIGIDSLFLDNRGDQKIPDGSRCIGVIRSDRRDGILEFLGL